MILNAADSTYESDDRRGRDLNTRNEIVAFHSPSLLSRSSLPVIRRKRDNIPRSHDRK